MCMLTRRLQILLDDDRYERLARRAEERGASVAALIREAIDTVYPGVDTKRRAAAAAILDAEPMAVPDDVAALRAEIDSARSRL